MAVMIAAWPRLLTRAHAARYLDMSIGAFSKHCDVVPIDFGDERLLRWDRDDLDAWVMKFKGYGDPVDGSDEAFEAVLKTLNRGGLKYQPETTDAEFEEMLRKGREDREERKRNIEERRRHRTNPPDGR